MSARPILFDALVPGTRLVVSSEQFDVGPLVRVEGVVTHKEAYPPGSHGTVCGLMPWHDDDQFTAPRPDRSTSFEPFFLTFEDDGGITFSDEMDSEHVHDVHVEIYRG
jgi:hypothetical protein